MSDDNVYQQVQLQVSNAQPGQRVSVEVSAQGSQIAWSTGPAFQSAGGININVPSGNAVPVGSFSVSSSLITVNISSNGGSYAALSFNLSLSLVAQAGIQNFSLRSRSDPGISVTASIGNSHPQTVNQTMTLFPWTPQ
ncbi:MAG: hypothetical protein ABIO21_16035 [Pseudomonas sp.]